MNPSMVHADAVRSFEVFSRHLNFTAAADELHVSQPSLHVKVSKLARSLGVDLYVRDGRRLELTVEGQRLAAFAAEQRRNVGDLLADLADADASHPLTISAGRGAHLWVIGSAVRGLIDAGTSVRLRVDDHEGVCRAVESGDADVGVVAHEPPTNHLQSTPIATFPAIVLLPRSHRLAERDVVGLAELADEPMILPPRGRPHRESIQRTFASIGITPRVFTEVDGWDLMAHFVALGAGISIVNGCVVPPPDVAKVTVDDLPSVQYWACWRDARSGRARLLVDPAVEHWA